MNKIIIIALIVAISSLRDEVKVERDSFIQFQDFVERYDKQYASFEEYMARYRVFKRNLRILDSNVNDVEGITKFFDMTENEFASTYLNLDITILDTIKYDLVREKELIFGAPENFNWVDEGALGDIKDQKSCGSCWAFSTVGNLEGLYHIKYSEDLRFSTS